MIRVLSGFAFFAVAAVASAASSVDYDARYDRCLTEAGGANNTSVLNCSGSVNADVKAEMNTLYDKLHTRLVGESVADADKLEATQKAWLVYRNGQCDLATSYVGSPMYGYCPLMLNIQRVKELRELLGE
ncbi:lysozyme inhibitor LprI family protein [Bordetella genomosp. 1]|uniref:Lysozyme inhibitor LprI-like N-terminal domain-containing protein n=1 Tax=Bordetella genomosp. 1 TaxID=1395607 RepID=A0ABX4F0R5_9BORD|nr:lysozyme inhibitor LprI family protein [Bordetella genomosp. 1]OZI63944.1 hypothetical protein CAL27_15240 [Bordetella genomosp. 1]